jgi:hypothetical protein
VCLFNSSLCYALVFGIQQLLLHLDVSAYKAFAASVYVLLTASGHAFLQDPVIFFQSFT